MNKGVVIVATLVIVGTGIFIFSSSTPKVEKPLVNQETLVNMDTVPSSRYVEYSKTAFDKASYGKRVLFFYANWCSTCTPANKNFEANTDKIPEGMTLIRVNYGDSATDEEEKELANRYGVTYQHTFVQIDKDGKEVTKWNGGQINELLANIK